LLRSYRPEELFDRSPSEAGAVGAGPSGERRMGANPNANAEMLLRDLRMPDFTDYGVDVPKRGVAGIGDTHVLGRFSARCSEVERGTAQFPHLRPGRKRCRMVWSGVRSRHRQWLAATADNDEFLARNGRSWRC